MQNCLLYAQSRFCGSIQQILEFLPQSRPIPHLFPRYSKYSQDGFPKMVILDACSIPDIAGITVFADFWFLIRSFSGIISFNLI